MSYGRKPKHGKRNKGDYSERERVVFYPTQRELAKLTRYKERNNFASMSQAICGMINTRANRPVTETIKVVLDGELAEKAEYLAQKLEYASIADWMAATITDFVTKYWGIADVVSPEWWGDE